MATFREQIQVSLGLDNRPFKQGLRQADSAASRFAKRFVAVMGPVLSAAAFTRFADKMTEFGARTQAAADKLGVTAEELQKFRLVAQEGGFTGDADVALQRFTRRLGEARQGTGELLPTLRQYGIAITDNAGRTRGALDVIKDLADATKNAADPAEQLRISFKAFDSEGAALVNTLRGGSEAIRQWEKDIGSRVVSDRTIRRLAEMRLMFDHIRDSLRKTGAEGLINVVDRLKMMVLYGAALVDSGFKFEAALDRTAKLYAQLETRLSKAADEAERRADAEERAAAAVEKRQNAFKFMREVVAPAAGAARKAEMDRLRFNSLDELAQAELAANASDRLKREQAAAQHALGLQSRAKQLAAQGRAGEAQLLYRQFDSIIGKLRGVNVEGLPNANQAQRRSAALMEEGIAQLKGIRENTARDTVPRFRGGAGK